MKSVGFLVKRRGIDFSCTGVGLVNPILSRTSVVDFESPSVSNLFKMCILIDCHGRGGACFAV